MTYVVPMQWIIPPDYLGSPGYDDLEMEFQKNPFGTSTLAYSMNTVDKLDGSASNELYRHIL